MSWSEARYAAVQALAHLHFDQSFKLIDFDNRGFCRVRMPQWGSDQLTNARIGMTGPALELSMALIEDDDPEGLTVRNMLTTWLEDVGSTEEGYFEALMDSGTNVSAAIAWSVAFVVANEATIDTAAKRIGARNSTTSHEEFARAFRGTTFEPDAASVEKASELFAGHLVALEGIEASISDIQEPKSAYWDFN
jgi:hypothetical protein